MGFLLIGLVLTVLGIWVGGITDIYYAHGYWGYWFVWPYLVVSLTVTLAATLGLFWPAGRREALYLAMFACILAPLLAVFAVTRWPGGDDGPGMAWMFFVIPASGLAGFLGGLALDARVRAQDRRSG